MLEIRETADLRGSERAARNREEGKRLSDKRKFEMRADAKEIADLATTDRRERIDRQDRNEEKERAKERSDEISERMRDGNLSTNLVSFRTLSSLPQHSRSIFFKPILVPISLLSRTIHLAYLSAISQQDETTYSPTLLNSNR